MGLFKAANLKELSEFAQTSEQLGLFERQAPQKAGEFTSKLLHVSLKLDGTVHKECALQDLQNLLQDQIPASLQDAPFYKEWLLDMVEISRAFCDALSDVAIRFRLGSARGCRRYHTDNVSMRLLVTYEGTGTEWLPDEAANREAYENGEPNAQIVLDPSAIQYMSTWDVAVFRGGSGGVLHRTPDAALEQSSLLMRLDPLPREDQFTDWV